MRLLLGFILFYVRFSLSFTAIGYIVRSLLWQEPEARLDGQCVLVTGASGGIGAATVAGCRAAGARVIAVARDPDKLDALKRDLPGIETVATDLAETAAVLDLVDALAKRGERIDVLVNNVGVMLHEHARNSEGIDKQFAVNLLNQYALTEHLSKAGVLAADAAVVSVSSGGMYMAPLVIAALNTDDAAAHDGQRAYAVQKRAQVALTGHWQRDAGERRFYAMHPGWVDTAGVKRSLPTFRMLLAPVLRGAAQGADTIVWLARTRPDTTTDTIWFDRKPRRIHVYGFTRERSEPVDALLAHLSRFIAPRRTDERPGAVIEG